MERKSILYVGIDTKIGLKIKEIALKLEPEALIVEARDG